MRVISPRVAAHVEHAYHTIQARAEARVGARVRAATSTAVTPITANGVDTFAVWDVDYD